MASCPLLQQAAPCLNVSILFMFVHYTYPCIDIITYINISSHSHCYPQGGGLLAGGGPQPAAATALVADAAGCGGRLLLHETWGPQSGGPSRVSVRGGGPLSLSSKPLKPRGPLGGAEIFVYIEVLVWVYRHQDEHRQQQLFCKSSRHRRHTEAVAVAEQVLLLQRHPSDCSSSSSRI